MALAPPTRKLGRFHPKSLKNFESRRQRPCGEATASSESRPRRTTSLPSTNAWLKASRHFSGRRLLRSGQPVQLGRVLFEVADQELVRDLRHVHLAHGRVLDLSSPVPR